MAPYYRLVTTSGALPLDQELLESMEKANTEVLQKLDERLAEAEKTEGESEIADTLKARANHFTRIGDKVSIKSRLSQDQVNSTLLGTRDRSTQTCAGEDPRVGLANRHCPHFD